MKPAVSLTLALLGLAPATARCYETNYNGSDWINAPVTIEVDTSGVTAAGSTDPNTLVSAVIAAAAKWNAALGLPLLRIAPSPDSNHAGDNAKNELYFSTQIAPGIEFASQFGSIAMRRNKAALLLEGDLIFNPAHRWLVYRGPLQHEPNGDRVPDLYRVALHEIGHLLGLAHPDSDAESTIMRSMMSDVDDLTIRDLHDGARVAEALLDHNKPRIVLPRASLTKTRSRQFVLRGTATPFFVSRVVVKIDSAVGVRSYPLRFAKSWRKFVPLEKGRNRLRFFYPARNGRLTLFARNTAILE